MKRTQVYPFAAMALAGFLAIASPGAAVDNPHAGHAGHGGYGAPPAPTGHEGHGEMAQAKRGGDNIRNIEVSGYKLAYHLIDMKKKMAAMKDAPKMPEMKSHHLMVYVMTPDGKVVTGAQTGFLVDGPDGKSQKVMAMGMGEGQAYGYGGDVDLKPGDYKIKTKVLIGVTKLMDEFTYKAK